MAAGAAQQLQICFTSDLHGHAHLYAALGQLILRSRPDLLILGGDLFPDGDVSDPRGTQTAWVTRVFLPMLAGWRRQLPELAIACIFGNHDWACTRRAVRDSADGWGMVALDHHEAWLFRGMNFLGFSYTPPTPYWVKDFERLDLPNDEIPELGGSVWDERTAAAQAISPADFFREKSSLTDKLSSVRTPPAPWVFVCHAPPHASKLDRLPHVPYPVGSRAVRSFIEARQPLLALHGHIHESPQVTGAWQESLGETLCVNPGQGTDRLHAVTFDAYRLPQTLRHTQRDDP